MEVEEEGKRVVCPMPCNLASLLSMNCRTRAEGLARRLQSHIKHECTLDIEGTWLVQTGNGVRVATTEGRTYSLDDHQLESFKKAADLKGLRPIHVVTSEPTLHLCLPTQPSAEELAAKAEHEQDSDVYYDFDLVTPPDDYANPGPSRMASREGILEDNDKQERPESGCVTSVTSPVMFPDDIDLAPSNPPSPFDENCPPELFNKRASDVDFDAVRELLSSTKFGCSYPGSDYINQMSPKELPEERPNGNSCSSSASSDDVEISLSFYDDDEESLLQPNSHTSLEENRSDIFSPPISTFQTFSKLDTVVKNHKSKPSSHRKRKTSKRNSNSSRCQYNSADLSPAANKIQRDSQKHDAHVDNSHPKRTRIFTNKLPYDLMRSHSLEGSLNKNKNSAEVFATARSLEKISKGNYELQSIKKTSYKKVDRLPEMHLQLESNRPGSVDDINQLPEDAAYEGNVLDDSITERDPHQREFYLTKDINRKLVTESRVNFEPPDKNCPLNRDRDPPCSLSTLDSTKIVNDIDNIIERLKNDNFIGKKLANYEDKNTEKCGTHIAAKEMPAENFEQVASSYIGWEYGARGRCQEEASGSANCDLCEKQVPFDSNKNDFSDEDYKEFDQHFHCNWLHGNKNSMSESESNEKEMPVSEGQIKVKRACADAKPSVSRYTEELLDAAATSFIEPLSSKCEQVRDERGNHEVKSASGSLYKTSSPHNDTEHYLEGGQSNVLYEGLAELNESKQNCCENSNTDCDDLLLDYSPIKCVTTNPCEVNGSCSKASPDRHCDFYHSLTTLSSEDVDSNDINVVDFLESDNYYLKESDSVDLKDSGYVDLTSSSGTFSVFDESDQNYESFQKANADYSNNPFLKEIVEAFPGETFHLFNSNDDRNVDSENVDNSINNEIYLNSHSEDEPQLFRQLLRQNSQNDGTFVDGDSPIRNDQPSENSRQSDDEEVSLIASLQEPAEINLSTAFAQNSLQNSKIDNFADPKSLTMLSDKINSDDDVNTHSDISTDILPPTDVNLLKQEDLNSSATDDNILQEAFVKDPSITNYCTTPTDEMLEEMDVKLKMSSEKVTEDLTKLSFSEAAGADNDSRSPERNESSTAGNIFVAIEEPGVLCLVQRDYTGDSNCDSKENILVRRDSAEKDIQIEVEAQFCGVMETDNDEEVIDTLPEDEKPDDENPDDEDDSDEEIFLRGKFKNIASYYATETIHHISDEDGSLPPPPTEVILIDFNEPLEVPREKGAEQMEVCSTTLADELERLEMQEPTVQPPSSDSERSSEEREQGGDLQLRIKRSSSLKCGKTPPGTPGRKKIVRFADALGLDLAAIRTYLDGVPNVPPSAFCDLQVEDDAAPQNQGFPSFASYSAAASAAAAALQNQARRILTPMFQQPGGLPDFYDRLREHKVVLENVSVGSDLSVKGVVRVVNEDFQKKVHIRYTFDHWKNHHEATATYVDGSSDGFSDRFSFLLWGSFLQSNGALIFCVKYSVRNKDYWDNNRGANYVLQCYSAPPVPLANAPAVEQSAQLLGRPQNHVNIEHRDGNGHSSETYNSDFGHQDHSFNSFMDTPNTPADPWIPRFF